MDFHNELYDKLYDQESGQLNNPKIKELLKRLPEMFDKGDLFEVENICSEIQYAIRLSNTRKFEAISKGGGCMDYVDEIIRMLEEMSRCPEDWENCLGHQVGNDCDNQCVFLDAIEMLREYKKLKEASDQEEQKPACDHELKPEGCMCCTSARLCKRSE